MVIGAVPKTLYEYKGELYSLPQLAKKFGISTTVLQERVKKKKSSNGLETVKICEDVVTLVREHKKESKIPMRAFIEDAILEKLGIKQ